MVLFEVAEPVSGTAMSDPVIDPSIEAFAPYLDYDRMRGVFQNHVVELFGEQLQVTGCELLESRYKGYQKPTSWRKSTLSICYRISTRNRDLREDKAVMYARVFLAGRSYAQWQQLQQFPLRSAAPEHSPQRHTVFHLPALDMIVWRFPYDPSIVSLPIAMNPEQVRKQLPFDRLPTWLTGPDDVVKLTSEVVKYSPEKCCTARYTLHCLDAGRPRTLSLYGKTYNNDRGAEIYARLRYFWRVDGSGANTFRIARPLAYADAIKTVWQLGVEGLPLVEVIDSSNYQHYIQQIGSGLATVHNSGLTGLSVIDVDELLADFTKKIDKLCRALPACAESLLPLVPKVRVAREKLGSVSRRSIYGDFHIGQMLACDQEVFFFDLDSFALGDPEQDLAEFIVALLLYGFDAKLVRAMADSLMNSYASNVSWKIRPSHVYWYALVEHVTRAHHHFRQQRPGWTIALQKSVLLLPILETVIPGLAVPHPIQ